MENIFSKHSLDRTKKLIYAYLVEKAEDSGDDNFQGAVVRSARRILGDINVSTTWSPFTGATPEDIWQLNKAKDLIIAWGARKTVDAFFDVCVQDPRRRKCWLEYVGNIMDYRIVGSTSVRTKLQANSEVAPLLRSCFIATNSKVSTTAALVLFIKDKVFVEFSDVGSLYIYNATNRIIRDIKKRRTLDSTSDLKDTSVGMAIDQYSSWSYIYNDEGRITHRGEWEERFRRWMREKMDMRPGQKVKYSIPKPLPATSNSDNFNSIEDRNFTDNYINSISESNTVSLNKIVIQPSLFNDNDADPKTDTTTTISSISSPCTPPGGFLISSKTVFVDTVAQIVANDKAFYIYIVNTKKYYYICKNSHRTNNGMRIWLKKADVETDGGSFVAVQYYNSIPTEIGILYKLNDISEIQFYNYETQEVIRIKTE